MVASEERRWKVWFYIMLAHFSHMYIYIYGWRIPRCLCGAQKRGTDAACNARGSGACMCPST